MCIKLVQIFAQASAAFRNLFSGGTSLDLRLEKAKEQVQLMALQPGCSESSWHYSDCAKSY